MVAKNESIVVTGGKGFLGRFVCGELQRRGYEHVLAIGVDDYDLVSGEACERMYAELKPRAVIHLAAAVGGIGANRDQPGWFAYANTMMGANIVEGARRAELDKLAIIGTVCMYPENAPVPTPESVLFGGYPAPVTAPYGLAKRNLWNMAVSYREQYGLKLAFLIPTNLYGPHDHFEEERSHVIPALIRRFVEAHRENAPEIVIWGDGSATRDFIYVEDAARGVADALERLEQRDPINLGTGREISIRELADMIRDIVGYRGKLVWDPSKPTGAPRRGLDTTAARRALGFSARTDFEHGLRATVEWYTSQTGA